MMTTALLAALALRACTGRRVQVTSLESELVNLPGPEQRALGIKAVPGQSPWDYGSFHIGDWPSKGYPLCDGKPSDQYPNNQFQSPINLPVARMGKKWEAIPEPLKLYRDGDGCEGRMFVDGHTFEVEFGDCTNLHARWKGVNYTLKQFHFHAESENLIDGHHEPAEVHMVHKSDDGQIMVIGVFIERPRIFHSENKFLNEVLSKGIVKKESVMAKNNPYTGFLAPGSTFYNFLGSLTTPPCLPGLEWLVMQETAAVDNELLDAFYDYLAHSPSINSSYGTNNRPAQPLNGRTFKKGKVCGSSWDVFDLMKGGDCTGLIRSR